MGGGVKCGLELFRKFIRFGGRTVPFCDYWQLVEAGFDKEGRGNATALCPSSSYSPARQRCFREIHQRVSNQDLKYCGNDLRQFWRQFVRRKKHFLWTPQRPCPGAYFLLLLLYRQASKFFFGDCFLWINESNFFCVFLSYATFAWVISFVGLQEAFFLQMGLQRCGQPPMLSAFYNPGQKLK